jgi:hypothetical protein
MARRHLTSSPESLPTRAIRHHDRVFDDSRHDPYQAKGKYRAPTVCRACGAIFENGRWRWGDMPPGARMSTCPACARTRDDLPAGYINLSGAFFAAHRDELLRLVRHTAEQERAEHPLHRIMHVVEAPGQTVITTCDVHSARRIGEAIASAYKGDLDVRFGEGEYSVRVSWTR